MASIPSGSDPLSLLPPLADVLASSRDAEPSEESNSTLETLDSAYDEEALEKLMGRYEQLSARFYACSERADGRRDSADGDDAGRDRVESDDAAPTPSAKPRPSKRQRRGGRRSSNKDAGFEGRLPSP